MDLAVRMLGSRVLVKPEAQAEYQRPDGLIVVEAHAPEVIGTVISCADGLEIRAGDVVLFGPEDGTVMEVGGFRYLVIDEADILAAWHEESEAV